MIQYLYDRYYNIPVNWYIMTVLINLKVQLLSGKTESFITALHHTADVNMLRSGPKVIKHLSCSTQLSMKLSQLINVEMPTIVGISTFMSRKNSILILSEPEKCIIS